MSLWRVNASCALRTTVASSARFSPRCGTRTRTLLPAHHAEELLVEVLVLGQVRDEHLLGHVGGLGVAVELLEDAGDQRRLVEVLDLVDDEPLAAHDPPAPDEEDLHRRLELVVGDPDDVELLGLLPHHLLALDRLADRGELVAQAGGALELELVGRARP